MSEWVSVSQSVSQHPVTQCKFLLFWKSCKDTWTTQCNSQNLTLLLKVANLPYFSCRTTLFPNQCKSQNATYVTWKLIYAENLNGIQRIHYGQARWVKFLCVWLGTTDYNYMYRCHKMLKLVENFWDLNCEWKGQLWEKDSGCYYLWHQEPITWGACIFHSKSWHFYRPVSFPWERGWSLFTLGFFPTK